MRDSASGSDELPRTNGSSSSSSTFVNGANEESRSRLRALPIRPRKPTFPFGTHIPNAWFGGSVLATHMVNGLNLLFPEGEQFFIRSVRAFRSAVEPGSELDGQVRGFIAQEVRHGMEHHRFFATLEAQGYELSAFLAFYEERFYPWLESRVPARIRLAGTVALEHYTATLGHVILSTDLLDDCDDDVRDLLMWHAAEEVEHKAVAFEVLQAANIGYGTRAAGMVLATAGLFGWWAVATSMLMRKERALQTAGRVAPARSGETREFAGDLLRSKVVPSVLGALVDYMRPDFHPADHDNLQLAIDYLRTMKPRH